MSGYVVTYEFVPRYLPRDSYSDQSDDFIRDCQYCDDIMDDMESGESCLSDDELEAELMRVSSSIGTRRLTP